MSQQMREVAADAKRSGPGLYLDFPLGVNPNGYDAKRYASSFANGVAVGAPPDLVFGCIRHLTHEFKNPRTPTGQFRLQHRQCDDRIARRADGAVIDGVGQLFE